MRMMAEWQVFMQRIEVRDFVTLLGSLAALALTAAFLRLLPDISPTTVSLALLLVVLGTATVGRLRVATVVSIAAMLTLNFCRPSARSRLPIRRTGSRCSRFSSSP